MAISAKATVELVWEARKNKIPEEQIAEQLAEAGLSSEQIAHIFEMIEFSLNRAFMETLGDGHTADFDGDPIFRASLQKAREGFPPSPGARREKWITCSAVGAAICVGLFAIGAVLYYAISLWLATH